MILLFAVKWFKIKTSPINRMPNKAYMVKPGKAQKENVRFREKIRPPDLELPSRDPQE